MHAALSVAVVGSAEVISVSTPEESLSVQTTANEESAATAARNADAFQTLRSESAEQSPTDAAMITAVSPSKRSIERKAKPSAKGKCQLARARPSKCVETCTASSASRSGAELSCAKGRRKVEKSSTTAPAARSVLTNCFGKR